MHALREIENLPDWKTFCDVMVISHPLVKLPLPGFVKILIVNFIRSRATKRWLEAKKYNLSSKYIRDVLGYGNYLMLTKQDWADTAEWVNGQMKRVITLINNENEVRSFKS